MSIRRLEPEHAALLADLEQAYPSGMQEGLERLRHKLGLLSRSHYSFCWGLFEGEGLAGYVLAWPQTSRLDDPAAGTVIYVDDLQVAPNRPYALYKLLKMLALDLRETGLAQMHLEGVCRLEVYELLLKHPGALGRLGYEMLGEYAYWEEAVGEELVWMRWAPIGDKR